MNKYAKSKELPIRNLVKMCCGKMDRFYPQEKNSINDNEFIWIRLTTNERQEIDSFSLP
jgi:hypothetical protein